MTTQKMRALVCEQPCDWDELSIQEIAVPARLQFDRGNVAIIDKTGVAFAASTERDQLAQIAYPEQKSVADIANIYRPWIVGGLWLATSLLLVVALQGVARRKRRKLPP